MATNPLISEQDREEFAAFKRWQTENRESLYLACTVSRELIHVKGAKSAPKPTPRPTPCVAHDPPPKKALPDPADATATSNKPTQPSEAFDLQTLRDFELRLTNEKGRRAIDSHRRSHLLTLLRPDFQPSRQDPRGVEKTTRQIKNEHSEKWRARRDFGLDGRDQIVRNPEGEYGARIVACTWDAAGYIIDRHRELQHAGSKKTFASLQRDVYGIRRQDVEYLTQRCALCSHKNRIYVKVDGGSERVEVKRGRISD